MSFFRVYEPRECGTDGYPLIWHSGLLIYGQHDDDLRYTVHTMPGPQISENGWFAMGGVKDAVRYQAGHRCVRCCHPYRKGCGVWGETRRVPPTGLMAQLEDGRSDPEQQRTMGTKSPSGKPVRPPLWSPCDEQCRHGGHVRARVTSARPWEERPEPPPGGIQAALAQGNEVQAAWRVLTVHHLNERKFDLRWWNLVSLCQRCHLTIQKKVVMEQVWPAEHTDWFKPYAAGWYSYAYLGEDLTREETMERLDDLLALERIT